ncbi:MAG TPA: hypothetical protein DCY20_11630 [Firmicutes bacterium]|nr:hypothetical protein [Bacillota bacterium]
MSTDGYKFLPEIKSDTQTVTVYGDEFEVLADSSCPCCGALTIPNQGDALGFICPLCLWEIDLFVINDDEQSDLNHGLSLNEARANVKQFGVIEKRFIRKSQDSIKDK